MDLTRIKSTREKVTIIAPERYPNTPVLTVLSHEDGKRSTLKLNREAMTTLCVVEGKNRLIMFEQYDLSNTDTPNYQTVIGVVSEDKVQGPERQHKAFDIHLSTRCVKSAEIYNSLVELFKLDTKQQHDFTIIPTNIPGVFTLDLITNPNRSEELEVEVELNRGEGISITEAEYNN